MNEMNSTPNPLSVSDSSERVWLQFIIPKLFFCSYYSIAIIFYLKIRTRIVYHIFH